jgi:hypothetical protein
MTTTGALLGRGYFPRELPPAFDTSTFADLATSSSTALPRVTDETQCASHSHARPGGLRRPLKIPNPQSYLLLAETIERVWPDLAAHFSLGRLSESRPLVRHTILDRAVVPKLKLSQLALLRVQRRVGARYCVHTDIGQFYPSLYTHSVPWALHTKGYAKANRKGNTGADLDSAIRRQQWGQTVGIPIGPDASLIVAEIVLTAVDVALSKQFKKLAGFRYVDDYEIYVRNLGDAEQVLADLQGLLAEYELVLNPRKTRIEEVPAPLDTLWASDLRQFVIRDNPTAKLNDTIDFFNQAFKLAADYRGEAVLRYALERTRGIVLHGFGKRTLHGLILGAAVSDPSTLPVAIGLLYAEKLAGREPSKAPLAETFDSIIERHAPLAHGSEVAWCLWGALRFGVSISERSARKVFLMSDDVVALLALHAEKKGLIPTRAVDHSIWTESVQRPNALCEEHWLLSYEAVSRGWLSAPVAWNKAPFFTALRHAGVRFFDDAQIANAPAFSGAAKPIPGGTISHDYF